MKAQNLTIHPARVPTPIALIVSFPSNPTAMTVDLDFYKEVVKFAKDHGMYILSDLAYAEIYFGDVPPPSILEERIRRLLEQEQEAANP